MWLIYISLLELKHHFCAAKTLRVIDSSMIGTSPLQSLSHGMPASTHFQLDGDFNSDIK